MLMLKRNYEYWYLIVALHKLGAVAIPATHTLMAADIAYRIKAVDVKAVVVTADNSDGPRELEKCGCDSVEKLLIRGQMPGFTDLNAEIEAASDTLERVETWAKEPMLLYFTSGTTGEPKAVMHDHSYALCHILTAKHWQNVRKGRPASERLRYRMGQGRLGQALRPVALRGPDHGLRLRPVRPPGADGCDYEVQGHHLLRAADHLPLLRQAGHHARRL